MFEETEFQRCTIFLKCRFFWKLITDFENRTKRQAETETCVVLDIDHPTEQVQSIFLQPEISTHFEHFRFECKH